MPSLHRARLIALSWLCLAWSGCLFPVIELEDLTNPHTIAVRARPASGYAHLSPGSSRSAPPRAANAALVAVPPRQHAVTARTPLPKVRRLSDASVIAPDVPAPELPLPTTQAACHQALRSEGVRYSALPAASTPGVSWPVRLQGPIAGVVFEPSENDPTYAVLDCRLALVLNEWAGELRRAGVRRVEYYSMYRPHARIAGSKRESGHAHGLAIDAARFTLRNGAVLTVLDDWEGRSRGDAPCPTRSDESGAGRLLRSVTCSAADRKLFQVVLTPHYNKAHDNHVHLEIKPDVDWTFVR